MLGFESQHGDTFSGLKHVRFLISSYLVINSPWQGKLVRSLMTPIELLLSQARSTSEGRPYHGVGVLIVQHIIR